MQKELKTYLERISVYNDDRYDTITSLLDELCIEHKTQEKSWETKSPIYEEEPTVAKKVVTATHGQKSSAAKVSKKNPVTALKGSKSSKRLEKEVNAFASLLGFNSRAISCSEYHRDLVRKDLLHVKETLESFKITSAAFKGKTKQDVKDTILNAIIYCTGGSKLYECSEEGWDVLLKFFFPDLGKLATKKNPGVKPKETAPSNTALADTAELEENEDTPLTDEVHEWYQSFAIAVYGKSIDLDDENIFGFLRSEAVNLYKSLQSIDIDEVTYSKMEPEFLQETVSAALCQNLGLESEDVNMVTKNDWENIYKLLWKHINGIEDVTGTLEQAQENFSAEELLKLIDDGEFDFVGGNPYSLYDSAEEEDYIGYPASSGYYSAYNSAYKHSGYGSYGYGSYGYGGYGNYGGKYGSYKTRKVVGYNTYQNKARNIIIPLSKYARNEGKKIVFMAHYDAVPKSTGANDNGSGVAILIAFAKRIVENGSAVPMEIVFTDREETGGIGCTMYAEEYGDQILEVINLDTCGVGEDIVTCDWSVHPSSITWNLIYHDELKELRPVFVRNLPYCDADIMHSSGYSVTGICTLPKKDVLSIMVGKPSYAETYKYMHNGECDDIKYINYGTMEKIVKYLMLLLD